LAEKQTLVPQALPSPTIQATIAWIQASPQIRKSASLHVGKPACMQAISLRSTPATMIGRQ
jgi:hypothetical protein